MNDSSYSASVGALQLALLPLRAQIALQRPDALLDHFALREDRAPVKVGASHYRPGVDLQLPDRLRDGMGVAQLQERPTAVERHAHDGGLRDGRPKERPVLYRVGDERPSVRQRGSALHHVKREDVLSTLLQTALLELRGALEPHVGDELGVPPVRASAIPRQAGGDRQMQDDRSEPWPAALENRWK